MPGNDTSALHYKILAPGTMKFNERMNVSYKGIQLNGTVSDEGDKTKPGEARLAGTIYRLPFTGGRN